MDCNRRSFLQIGLGSALFAGIGLPLAARRARAASASARALIVLNMEGGPSQIDTFDPKPGRPTGGEFKAIGTRVAGIQVSEHLPRLAERMQRLAVIRSLTSREGNHARARYLLHTGYPPQGGVDHPALGSLVAEARPPRSLPGYVSIGGPGKDAGFLGAAFSPFPVRDPSKPVRYLSPPADVDPARFDERIAVWRGLEDDFAASHPGPQVAGQRAVAEQALAMMRSPDVRAFGLDEEPAKVRSAYGATPFAAGCLMARRLVEAGVPFVEVTQRGWDTHKDNFATVKKLSGELDQAMSALLDDLEARGLLAGALVVWMGEFGRTPLINGNAGRDHYPGAFSAVLAGGGVRGGQVIGATDADGVAVVDRPVGVPDLFRSLATAAGLEPDKARTAPSGRPIKTVDGGTLVAGLF